MSWLTEYVRPKIRTLFATREVPDNLWRTYSVSQLMGGLVLWMAVAGVSRLW